jgi:hypothetical protein
MSQGKRRRATVAKTNQVFSHRQRREYFMGAGKLPFNTPLTKMIAMPSQKCLLISVPCNCEGLEVSA